MNILPAIDLLDRQCVRLFQGCFDEVTVYSDDPITMAMEFETQGAQWLHIVDLEGAKSGVLQQMDIIADIKNKTQLKIQMGGGIRTKNSVKQAIESGVDRLVIGSMACRKIETMKNLIDEYGNERFTLAFDVNIKGDPIVAVSGWADSSNITLWSFLEIYQAYEDLNILCTDIGCDGVMQGPNFLLYKECIERFPRLNFQASGGVASLQDLSVLKMIGVNAVVTGKAIYENVFSVNDAMEMLC